MPKTDLKFHGLATGLSDGSQPHLNVSTPSGQIRQIPLERRDLVKIIQQAAAAIERLDREEARDA